MKKLILVMLGLIISMSAAAELQMFKQSVLSDSEEPFDRRIYSYDFDVSADGTIHVIYSKPVPGADRAQIVYMSKPVGGDWPEENKRTILEEFGARPSISTWLIYDNQAGTAHISYIVRRTFKDSIGVTHTGGLVYQTIKNGVVSAQINASPGEFNTRMQLNKDGLPIFAREYEVFLNSDGTIRKEPFPKALRIQMPKSKTSWTDREYILNLPTEIDYRLANFVYDSKNNRFHITYGDQHAEQLRNAYPTTNPPVTGTSNPVYFPPGSAHKLKYAYSDDLKTWKASTVDDSGNLSENEFWTDLITDPASKPYISSYRYKTDKQGVQQGSTGVFASIINNQWNVAVVAGNTTGASEPRAGASAKLLQDAAGGFHGIWDNSPDAPIDSESARGSTMYHYSPDGVDWMSRQMILPFSVEGACRAKIFDNKLLLMVLGDARDARLVFAEYQMPKTTDKLLEVATDKMFYGAGESVKFHVRLQGDAQKTADYYLVVAGPYNVNAQGAFENLPTTTFRYLGSDYVWREIPTAINASPALSNSVMMNYSAVFLQASAKGLTPPFSNSSRYRIYSIATEPFSKLTNIKQVSPLYYTDIHICNNVNCSELGK